jgi:hypothetical protein
MARGRKHKVGKKHSKKSHVRLEPTLKHMGAHKKVRKSIRRKKA